MGRCFNPDGVFVDESVGVTYRGPSEVGSPLRITGRRSPTCIVSSTTCTSAVTWSSSSSHCRELTTGRSGFRRGFSAYGQPNGRAVLRCLSSPEREDPAVRLLPVGNRDPGPARRAGEPRRGAAAARLRVAAESSAPNTRKPIPDDQPSDSRPARRPSHHPAERGVRADRLPAVAVRDGPLDGPGSAAREHRLDREDRESVRTADRPLDRQRRIRPAATDRSRARRTARGQPSARPHDSQLMGGHRVRAGRPRDRTPEAHLLRVVDRGLHGVRGARRPARGLRGLSRRGRDRRHVARGAPRRLERVIQAGAQPISWVSLACELQRDWARLETVPAIVEIVLTDRLLHA